MLTRCSSEQGWNYQGSHAFPMVWCRKPVNTWQEIKVVPISSLSLTFGHKAGLEKEQRTDHKMLGGTDSVWHYSGEAPRSQS